MRDNPNLPAQLSVFLPVPRYFTAEISKCTFFPEGFVLFCVPCWPVHMLSWSSALAAAFGLTILQRGTCFEMANIPTKDRVSAPLPLFCPARLFLGTPRAFRLPCTLFWEVLQSGAFACSPPSVSSVLDEFALCGVFLFIYCKQIWSLPFVYSYTLSLCLGMHF